MTKQLFTKILIWGTALWVLGYLLGIILFMFVPTSLIGWIITPIGITLTIWVLLKKFDQKNFRDYFAISLLWTTVAIVLDYFLLVQLFKPADGYYKLDVYLYYLATFTIPLIVGWKKSTLVSKKPWRLFMLSLIVAIVSPILHNLFYGLTGIEEGVFFSLTFIAMAIAVGSALCGWLKASVSR